MKKQMQYLVKGITKDIIVYIMENSECGLSTALKEFYNSETFTKLSDEAIGLYNESSAYVYDILKGKLLYNKALIGEKYMDIKDIVYV